MLGITFRDEYGNELRLQTLWTLKWHEVGHVEPADFDQWKPREIRCIGKPQRWVDYIKRVAVRDWIRTPQDRENWKVIGEAYVQEWTNID